jgi:hypothetical protein
MSGKIHKTPLTLSLSKGLASLPHPLTLTKCLALALILTLTACAAPTHYMGLDLASPATPDSLRNLASRAMTGDKQAQLDLGIAFEEGQGVPKDWNKAKKLYRMAAATSGGTIWVYQPGVGNGTRGGVVPIDLGPVQFGIENAKEHLSNQHHNKKQSGTQGEGAVQCQLPNETWKTPISLYAKHPTKVNFECISDAYFQKMYNTNLSHVAIKNFAPLCPFISVFSNPPCQNLQMFSRKTLTFTGNIYSPCVTNLDIYEDGLQGSTEISSYLDEYVSNNTRVIRLELDKSSPPDWASFQTPSSIYVFSVSPLTSTSCNFQLDIVHLENIRRKPRS